jgi:2-polyprenyl-3-methyl-5-hydroxy-6-metoxy-1,4-benzoquinol methylase
MTTIRTEFAMNDKDKPDLKIEESEKKKYLKAWYIEGRAYAAYSPGLELSNFVNFLGFFKVNNVKSILDAGIGSGKLCKKMLSMGFDCHGVDIADNCLDEDLLHLKDKILTVGTLWDSTLFKENQFDAVVCLDVLEHIPTQYIEQVINNLYKWTKKYVLLQIALVQDYFGSKVGEPLHLTVEAKSWWDTKLIKTKVIDEIVLKNNENRDTYAIYLIEKP